MAAWTFQPGFSKWALQVPRGVSPWLVGLAGSRHVVGGLAVAAGALPAFLPPGMVLLGRLTNTADAPAADAKDLPAVFIAVVVDLVAGTVTAEESAAGGARTVSVSESPFTARTAELTVAINIPLQGTSWSQSVDVFLRQFGAPNAAVLAIPNKGLLLPLLSASSESLCEVLLANKPGEPTAIADLFVDVTASPATHLHAPPALQISPCDKSTRAIVVSIALRCRFLASLPFSTAGRLIFDALTARVHAMVVVLKANPNATPCVLDFDSDAFSLLPVSFVFANLAASPLTTPAAAYASERLQLHSALATPPERPLFRACNSIQARTLSPPDRLRNVHTHLKPSAVGGILAVVEGDYDYYHYKQDKIDDKGWGCAYRSIQTICSWFVLQGYSQKPVPTHRQIQEVLVAKGGRPMSLIGSSQWVGSVEASMFLNVWFEDEFTMENAIDSEIPGADLPSHVRVLERHFKQNGTPVIIGGNLLAHTILGIDYNAKTGELNYLILDPHYIGPDDPKAATTAKGVLWKGPEYFNAQATYSLCRPSRPILF